MIPRRHWHAHHPIGDDIFDSVGLLLDPEKPFIRRHMAARFAEGNSAQSSVTTGFRSRDTQPWIQYSTTKRHLCCESRNIIVVGSLFILLRQFRDLSRPQV